MAQSGSKRMDNMIVLIATIQDCQLLLPDAAVAEIIEFQQVEPESDDMPTWYLGKLPWRGYQVPLISLENLNHDAFFTQGNKLKIIVLHSASHRDKMPYWGFVSLATPSMNRINKSSLSKYEVDELHAMEKIWAVMDEDEHPAMIPDMEKIEQQIVKLL